MIDSGRSSYDGPIGNLLTTLPRTHSDTRRRVKGLKSVQLKKKKSFACSDCSYFCRVLSVFLWAIDVNAEFGFDPGGFTSGGSRGLRGTGQPAFLSQSIHRH